MSTFTPLPYSTPMTLYPLLTCLSKDRPEKCSKYSDRSTGVVRQPSTCYHNLLSPYHRDIAISLLTYYVYSSRRITSPRLNPSHTRHRRCHSPLLTCIHPQPSSPPSAPPHKIYIIIYLTWNVFSSLTSENDGSISNFVAIAQLGERQTEVHFGCLSGGHVFNPHLAQCE